MHAEAKAKELGIVFTDDAKPAYLRMAVKTGILIITSGHVSNQKGKLGDAVTVEQGYEAAKQVATNTAPLSMPASASMAGFTKMIYAMVR